jgi:NADH-quinone oxidoreductase subunit L
MSLTVFLPLFAGIFQLIVSAGAPPCSVFLVQIALTLSYGCVWGSLGSFLLNLLTIGSVDQSIIVYRIYSWSSIAGVELGLSLLFDYIAIIMSFTVLTVSICVQWYSVYYMRLDPHFNRFLVYLSWFTFCMLLLVSAEDLLQFFIG